MSRGFCLSFSTIFSRIILREGKRAYRIAVEENLRRYEVGHKIAVTAVKFSKRGDLSRRGDEEHADERGTKRRPPLSH
jgi:hypothetical protein